MATTSNFCTPQNDRFYSKKPYGGLDRLKKEIRLIRVLQDDGSGQIRCELTRELPLSEAQDKYAALSYCAGSPQNPKPILVRGNESEEFHEFNAFANLELAIADACEFCKKHRGDEEPLLWVDQVCINQNDDRERSHQVGFMRDIYQCAREVIVCLSTDKSTSLAVDWLLAPDKPELDEMFYDARAGELSVTFQEQVKRSNIHARTRVLMRTNSYVARKVSLRNNADTIREDDFVRASMSDNEFYYGWLDVLTMLGQPWWTRAWIYQEFMVCKNAQFLFGQSSISWRQLSAALVPFIEIFQSRIPLARYYCSNRARIGAATPLVERMTTILEREISVEDSMTAAKSLLKNKSSFQIGREIFNTVLAHSRLCRATDPRDLVYAFISLADIACGIEPDYSHDNTVHNVFITAARRAVVCSGNLDILSHAVAVRGDLSLELPSWVPDLTAMESAVRRDRSLILQGLSSKKVAPLQTTPRFPISFSEDGRILYAKGSFVVSLERRMPDGFSPWPPVPLGHLGFEASGYVIITTDRTATLSDEIWILDGPRRPFVLRRSGDHYKLVCMAVVTHTSQLRDFMDWENVKKAKAPVAWKSISIC
ncbi:heterokaryon incompatibility protein or allele [Diplodia corticola]|uniref:Heterokaryon incompatibility protein or allele n=1 Tax=Diplodia corticola TaxID=236234 RepID=A0A1J9R2Z6_9PEZI|nr:heterokaryon incompatibility protein or allele [Diplodia corticola]OJD34984.1 heterokaryon incompatibility protein or allele [Diplodia corticola]